MDKKETAGMRPEARAGAVFLTGFMGCGKSTVGGCLSRLLSLPFTDTDARIEQEQKKSISEIFAQVGEEENIQVAHEVHLEKIYDTEGNINFTARDLENTQISIQRLKELLQNSQVTNSEGGKTVVRADSIHFSNKLSNAKELIMQAREIVEPLPYNYMNAQKSGWVE